MAQEFSIDEPIINGPFDEPEQHWKISAHEPPVKVNERRKATYFFVEGNAALSEEGEQQSTEINIELVEAIRPRLKEWRKSALRGGGGVTKVTAKLLSHWRRKGRQFPLFFAQVEAAETIIFLNEARQDFLQGITVPKDDIGEGVNLGKQDTTFQRHCCKMATGAGKTTVMAMLAAWSILNKVSNRSDKRFSSLVLVMCPNVTIRDRLAELDPRRGDASIYRTRDLVPKEMIPQLMQGSVLTTNWHVFEPRSSSSAKVVKAGKRRVMLEKVYIGARTTTLRGMRYMTVDDLRKKHALKLIKILTPLEQLDTAKFVMVESVRYVESDRALVKRVLGRDLGNGGNILVLNDEAHHAYRTGDSQANDLGEFADASDAEYYRREATVWVEGLDRVHADRGINQCIDFSATPYFLGNARKEQGRIFPWTVSNFGLQDAIEAGLVKVPQLAARDSTGAEIPGYFNIWRWIKEKITPAERGSGRSEIKPAAVLKYAHTPMAMLGGEWDTELREWHERDEQRPPVMIIVCKTTRLSKVVYEWLADDKPPNPMIPKAKLPELLSSQDREVTVRIDSKVQHEIDSGNAKNDEHKWMRHLLDTVGKTAWPEDSQGRKKYPDGFEELAAKLGREQFLDYPPGRDVRCIVSVGMLTEGWDCNTVTHIIGLRPFMSQLLCEQVIGRGLRRASYEVGDDGLMDEEVAQVLGVPLSLYPVKTAKGGKKNNHRPRKHIHAVPQKERDFRIDFPHLEGYKQKVGRMIACEVNTLPELVIDGINIPQEVEMAAGLPDNKGRYGVNSPGDGSTMTLEQFRKKMRLQERQFELTIALMKYYQEGYAIPPNMLFAQLYKIVSDYVEKRVKVSGGAQIIDAFMSPYFGYIIKQLSDIPPDESSGGVELPRLDAEYPLGSTSDVDFWTKRPIFDVSKSHVNAVVADTKKLEQEAAYRLDNHGDVQSFVKNEGLGFTIPYHYEDREREYCPDFLVRLRNDSVLILETKAFIDPAKDHKRKAAERWVKAVNADGSHGYWHYEMISSSDEVDGAVARCVS